MNETLELKNFAEKAYLDYSMAVVLDRAVPHIADGLKPVQRRILHAMSELGLISKSKPKKAARTVGDVLGKYHPHGDSACYEAMVLMAQDFSFRYPLIAGQGNWGSTDDPKSFAAMRYTEAKLSSFSELLLEELHEGTVEWVANFDGTLQEPKILPARVPVILANGASGIAVGMATDIPPHNLGELIDATVALVDDPLMDARKLASFVSAPDFPSGGEIVTPLEDIERIYTTGHGSLKLRARWERNGSEIIITELPYQVTAGRVLTAIAREMQAKRVPMLQDLRDESNYEQPIRLVLKLRSRNVDADVVMSHLFAVTELEKSLRVNMNVIGLNGKPQVKSLQSMLKEWIQFRLETIKKRTEWRLNKVSERLHLLDGLLVALLDIDRVIRIVRTEDDPKLSLCHQLGLDSIQADYVLETRLRQLARLEEIKVRGEAAELKKQVNALSKILASETRRRKVLRTELEKDRKLFADARRTGIAEREPARAFSEDDLVPADPMTVLLSAHGWVRCAKGHAVDLETVGFRTGDFLLGALETQANHTIAFFSASGRVYTVKAHALPSARGYGEPLSGRFEVEDQVHFVGLTDLDSCQHAIVLSAYGKGFMVRTSELVAKTRTGKRVLLADPPDEGIGIFAVSDAQSDSFAVATSEGYLVIISARDIPQLQRGKGVRLVGIPARSIQSGERVVAATTLPAGKTLRIGSGKRDKVLASAGLEDYLVARGRRGTKLSRGFRSVTKLICSTD